MRRSFIAMVFVLALGLGLGLGLTHQASAQANNGCGPQASWNGQTCIGPKGKAYCPANMTLKNGTCVFETINAQIAPVSQAEVQALKQQVAALQQQLNALQTKFANHYHSVPLVTQTGKTFGETHIPIWNALGVVATGNFNTNPTVYTSVPH